MALSKRWHLLVTGLLSLALAAVLVGRLHCPGDRPGKDEDRRITLAGHTRPVQALAFSPDGATLTSAACYVRDPRGMEVADWDAGTGNLMAKRTENPGTTLAVAFAPGGANQLLRECVQRGVG
jgi:hypothetical protein